VLALGLTGVAAGAADEVTLSLDQARILGVEALRRGEPALAGQVGRGLLKADQKDAFAYFLIARAEAGLGHADTGRRAAARAYRYADAAPDRFASAQLAARLAHDAGRPTLAQVWLRRSAVNAPDAAAELVVARDYRVLRVLNPWSFRLRTEVKPSSNVNKGADSALQIIDGVPVTGWLTGAAQALSGLIGTVDLSTAYRFRQTRDSATSVAGRLYLQRVALSSQAQTLAPAARNSDFASTFAEISLRHGFRAGAAEAGGSAAIEAATGESWWGGQRSFRYVRIGAERTWALTGGGSLAVQALAEKRFMARISIDDAQVLGLGVEIGRPLANGNRLDLTLALRDSAAQHPNGSYRSMSLRLGYGFGRPVGPVRLNAGVVLGYSDYPEFWSAGFIPVPGGRQDRSVYGDIGMMFDRLDYAGFAPMLRLRAGRKISNDSRFSMREMSLSLGVESKF
jgi:hypothetical protein